MILGLFAIKDTKSDFWKPFTHHNDQTALREFNLMVNTDQNPVSECPADYELWHIGSFDTVTGKVDSDLQFVAGGSSLKKVITE